MGQAASLEGAHRATVITILVDHNIEGQSLLLAGTLGEQGWLEFLPMRFVRLTEVGLLSESSDREVWRFAQANQMFLLTNNRNNDGKDSLQQTLDDENTTISLPVINMRRPNRIYENDYREACAERLLEIVLYPEDYLGTQRQFIP